MARLLPLVVVSLLLCSLLLIAIPSVVGEPAAPEPMSQQAMFEEDAPEWLTLSDGPAASGDGYVTIDIGAALDDDANQLESQYDEHRLDARMEAADSEAERRAIIREEESRLSQSVEQLREREQTAYTDYYEGKHDERELLSELAIVHTNAVALEDSISTLEDHAGDVSDVSLTTQIETMEVEALTMQGPVREQVGEMLRGETDSARVHVETDGEGVVLGVIDGGEFHREAYRADNRNPDGETQYGSLGQSEDRIEELYPSVFPDARWSYSEVGYGTHRGVGKHAQGSLTVYLDTATDDVYREFQTFDLDRTETTLIEEETEDEVNVSVSQTVPGGPAKVTLTDAETDAPLSGEVTINDRTIGQTNDAGEVWFVAPRDSMTIVADVGDTEIKLTVSEDSATARAPADDESS